MYQTRFQQIIISLVVTEGLESLSHAPYNYVIVASVARRPIKHFWTFERRKNEFRFEQPRKRVESMVWTRQARNCLLLYVFEKKIDSCVKNIQNTLRILLFLVVLVHVLVTRNIYNRFSETKVTVKMFRALHDNRNR